MQDKVVVVTGSSSGIGKAIACRLATESTSIILHARRSESCLKEVKAAIEAAGANAEYLLCDFSKQDIATQFVENAWGIFGRIDGWVNNAGGDVLTGDAGSWSSDEKLEYLWKTDVRSTFQLSRAVGMRMKQHAIENNSAAGSRWILNMGWDQANHGMAGDSGEIFATTKGAIMAMTRSFAQSLAPHVRVNCLAPGWIKTKWGDSASEYWEQRAKTESLMQRWGTPQDVADVASFLSSESAHFVSGQIVEVNGGFRIDGDLPDNDWNG